MSTVESHRANSLFVADMNAALSLPCMQTAQVLLETDQPVADVADDAPEVASVRRLSFLAGWMACLNTLRSLAVSVTSPPEEPEPTYPPPETINQ